MDTEIKYDKLELEFLKTLGKHTYQYIGEDGQTLYHGRGGGKEGNDRAVISGVEKGYNINDCWITSRNTEKFKSKDSSHAIESYLIEIDRGRDNKVSGAYSECFVKTKLVDLYEKWKLEQVNPYEGLSGLTAYPFMAPHPDIFENKDIICQADVSSGRLFLETSTLDRGFFMQLFVYLGNKPPMLRLCLNSARKGYPKLEESIPSLSKEIGYEIDQIENDGKVKKFEVICDDVDELVNIFVNYSK